MRRLLLASLALALAACNNDSAPQYLVQDVRLLAIRGQVQADPAWADVIPGDTLQLTALVGNPASRAVTVTWIACLPLASERLPPCFDDEVLGDPARLRPATLDPGGMVTVIGAGASVAFPLTGDVATKLEAALAFTEARATTDPAWACAPYAEIGVIAVVEGGPRREVGLKRVRVTRLHPVPMPVDPSAAYTYVPNKNPVIFEVKRAPSDGDACAGGVVVDGAAPFPAGTTQVCATWAAGSNGAFNQCDPTRSAATESPWWQWYVTAGEFPDLTSAVGNARGSPLDFTPPAGRGFTVWTILRDGRGGVDWVQHDVPAP